MNGASNANIGRPISRHVYIPIYRTCKTRTRIINEIYVYVRYKSDGCMSIIVSPIYLLRSHEERMLSIDEFKNSFLSLRSAFGNCEATASLADL